MAHQPITVTHDTTYSGPVATLQACAPMTSPMYHRDCELCDASANQQKERCAQYKLYYEPSAW